MTETMTPDNLFAGSHPEPVPGAGTLKLGAGSLARGTVLGRVRKSISAAVAGTNAGSNGTCTGVALRALAQAGAYLLTCIGGELAASAGDCVGTGAGSLTLDVTNPVDENVMEGVYIVACIAEDTNSGAFVVFAPDGSPLGSIAVGGTFDNHIKFVIADSGEDFDIGDYFEVTVAQAVPANGLATFSVTDPDGNRLADALTGTEYEGEIVFTLNDGTQNFDIGDTFTITVTVTDTGAEELVTADSDNVDGSEEPWCILAEAKDASSAAKVAPVYLQGCFNQAALIFGTGDTYATHKVALRRLGIILQPVIDAGAVAVDAS